MRENELPLGMSRLVRNYSTYSVIVAAIVTVWGFFGWGFPLVKAQDYERDRKNDKAEVVTKFEQLGSRVERLENAVTSLGTTVLEGQEMQLRIALQDMRLVGQERIRVEQSLRKIQSEIARRMGAGER